MKIAVVGTRGIPQILGGVETHCQELYPRIVALGCEVFVMCRKCYVDEDYVEYKGVKLIHLFALKHKYFEAIFHTFLGIIKARKLKVDILHIHAIGSALLIPFAHLIGLKCVVVTHHGADYDRQKWGMGAKWMLRMGERYCARYADEVIVISDVINESLQQLYLRDDAHLIFNGVNLPKAIQPTGLLNNLGIKPGKYILAAGRFVPEKGFDLLIDAYCSLRSTEYKLVIAGDADHKTEYSVKLKKQAADNNIILTGYIMGTTLAEVFANARLFVLPSYHEGLPIGLLEAMSYNLDVLVSDIPSTKTMQLPRSSYFCSGDDADLCAKLREKLSCEPSHVQYDMSLYDWEHVARQTVAIYQKMISQ